jgi:5-enolpyruvylshikimate-3-phosphate synthase
MSLALLGLRKNVTVGGAEILEESFPGFAETLASLYPPLARGRI